MSQRRRIQRGSIIAQRLDERLNELGWGSIEKLLSKLHQIGGHPGFTELSELQRHALSKIRHGSRPCYDYELVAISEALGVNVYWLTGLSDDKAPPPGVRHLLIE